MHSSRMRTGRLLTVFTVSCLLPRMPSCHAHPSCQACPPCHACPPATHAPCHVCLLPHIPLAMHAPCHACPLPCTSPAMHAPCHAHPLPCMSPTVNRMTDDCENITFPQLLLRMVKTIKIYSLYITYPFKIHKEQFHAVPSEAQLHS